MGRMWKPPALPTSFASSQSFPPAPPNLLPPPILRHNRARLRLLPFLHLNRAQPALQNIQIVSSTRVFGFDLNEHWQADRDQYDNQKIDGLTPPRAIRQSAFRSWTLKDVIPFPYQ